MYYQLRRDPNDNSPKSFQFYMTYVDAITHQKRVLSTTIKNPGKRLKPTAKDQQVALAILSGRKDEILGNSMTPKRKDISLHEVVELYLEYQKSSGIRPTTTERNQRQLEVAEKILGKDTLMSKLTPLYIHNQYCAYDNNPVTTNERLTRLRACLRWAAQNDLCKDIPIRLLAVPASHRQRIQDKYYSSADINILLSHIRKNGEYSWYLMIKFLLLSGLRIGEAIALEKTDVDFEKKNIRVNKTYVLHPPRQAASSTPVQRLQPPKTFDSLRDVYCQAQLRSFLQDDVMPYMELLEKQAGNTSKLLFHNKEGDYISYDALRVALRRYCERTGCSYKGIHALRHTHASFLAAASVPQECISHRLGHRSFSYGSGASVTSDIYLHVVNELEQKWNEILEPLVLFQED